MIIQHDDLLEIIAFKTDNGKRRKRPILRAGYKDKCEIKKDRTGARDIRGYINTQKKTISVKNYKKLSIIDRGEYAPIIPREYRPKEIKSAQIEINGNCIKTRIYDLSKTAELIKENRYKKLLDVIMKAGRDIFNINPREKKRPDRFKHYRERHRQMIKRDFHLHKYEYNFTLIYIENAIELIEDLKPIAIKEYKGTLYIKDVNGPGPGIKIYDYGKKNGLKDEAGGPKSLYKLEITFRAETFKALGLKIQNMTFQDKCINFLKREIFKTLDKLSDELKKKTGKVSRVLEAVKMHILKEENILFNMFERLEKLERDIKEIKQTPTVQKEIKRKKQAREYDNIILFSEQA